MIIEKKKGGVGRGNKKQAELLHTVTGGGVCVCVCLCPWVSCILTEPQPSAANIPQARAEEIWVLVAPEGSQALAALTAKLLPNAGMI